MLVQDVRIGEGGVLSLNPLPFSVGNEGGGRAFRGARGYAGRGDADAVPCRAALGLGGNPKNCLQASIYLLVLLYSMY